MVGIPSLYFLRGTQFDLKVTSESEQQLSEPESRWGFVAFWPRARKEEHNSWTKQKKKKEK